jgi:hypothetical protein
MFSAIRRLLCLVTLMSAVLPVIAHAQSAEARRAKADELLAVHKWRTTVALGNRYLKQQSLMAVRSELARLGREGNLGKAWRPGNSQWDAAEASMAAPLLDTVQRDWTSLAWLPPEWAEMTSRSFTDAEMDALVAHFRTEVGAKQARIIEQSVAFHVGGALTMSGKLIQDFPGTAEEQRTLTYVYAEEDKAMRFSVASNDNAEGQQFALSDLGAKYQKTLMIKMTGILNARMDAVAATLPVQARAAADTAGPMIAEFRAANPG